MKPVVTFSIIFLVSVVIGVGLAFYNKDPYVGNCFIAVDEGFTFKIRVMESDNPDKYLIVVFGMPVSVLIPKSEIQKNIPLRNKVSCGDSL